MSHGEAEAAATAVIHPAGRKHPHAGMIAEVVVEALVAVAVAGMMTAAGAQTGVEALREGALRAGVRRHADHRHGREARADAAAMVAVVAAGAQAPGTHHQTADAEDLCVKVASFGHGMESALASKWLPRCCPCE